MIKTTSKVGNSHGVIFDAALMELAQPHPRPHARHPRCPSIEAPLALRLPRLE